MFRTGFMLSTAKRCANIFSKGSLGEEDREVTVGVMTPGQSCAEKVIDCTHEVDFNFACQQLFE